LKKLSAILLLIVFFFHLVGYRALFFTLEQQWEQKVQIAFDNQDYDEADLVMITTPLMLPYVTDTKDFQRVDGEINVNGKVYRYVKSKVENGEYVLLCLPDQYQQKLEKGKRDIAGNADETLLNGGKKQGDGKTPAFRLPLVESGQHYFPISSTHARTGEILYHHSQPAALAFAAHISPEQPPDQMPA